jgi:DNA-binding transcriptional LysR family regulator
MWAKLLCMDATRSEQHANWDDLRILLAVAREGSFLAAARELSVVTSTISRRVTAMERQAKTALVERRTDGVSLTEAGHALSQLAERMEAGISAAYRDLAAAAQHLQGTIRITMGDGFADATVAAIASFNRSHPDIRFEVAVESRVASMTEHEADLALRTVDRQESTLIYRRLGELRYGLWAAKDYARRAGVPKTLGDVAAHQFIGFAAPLHRHPVMPWLASLGVQRWTLLCTTFGAQLAAARLGVGIAPLPNLSATDLIEVLPQKSAPSLTLYLVSSREALRKPHIRVFADALYKRVKEIMAVAAK